MYKGYDIKYVNGHYDVCSEGKFIMSVDTCSEAWKGIDLIESDSNMQ